MFKYSYNSYIFFFEFRFFLTYSFNCGNLRNLLILIWSVYHIFMLLHASNHRSIMNIKFSKAKLVWVSLSMINEYQKLVNNI